MTSYQDGDEIQINGQTVILIGQRSFRGNGTRWSWGIPRADQFGEVSFATAEEAVAHVTKTLNAPCCAHGQPTNLFCIPCHDSEA